MSLSIIPDDTEDGFRRIRCPVICIGTLRVWNKSDSFDDFNKELNKSKLFLLSIY